LKNGLENKGKGMKKNDGFNRPIFYRKHRVWHGIVNRRNAIVVCGALFFTWLGYYFGDVPCFVYKTYFA
jgi:hypothetical protein